jgi:hypothetical protein
VYERKLYSAVAQGENEMKKELIDDKTDSDTQSNYHKSHEHYNPVVVTDTIGALFLGIISIVLMGIVGVLLRNNRKLENQLKAIECSLDQ